MPIDQPSNAAIILPLLFVVTLCAVTDVLTHRIPNLVLWPALSLALLINSLLTGLPGLVDCIFGLALGLAVLFPIYFVGGTSAGDVKLLGVVGALLGANGALIAGVATLFFGGLLGVLFIAWRVIQRALAAHVAQWAQNTGAPAPQQIKAITRDRSGNAQFPYAPAIACGTYFSIWHLGYFSQVAG